MGLGFRGSCWKGSLKGANLLMADNLNWNGVFRLLEAGWFESGFVSNGWPVGFSVS